jgi:glycerol-3-phosphate dehydrogenase (NAD(P)+)
VARLAVLGAGAWGTALAIHLNRCGHQVVLLAHSSARAEALRRDGENRDYLPGIPLAEAIAVTADPAEALTGRAGAVLVVPSNVAGEVAQEAAAHLPPEAPLICASKGLEQGTGRLMHEVLAEALGDEQRVAVLSGPSFADEVGRGLPAAVTLAHRRLETAESLAEWLRCEPMRVYSSDDPVGVELGGAIKNVIAIAAGISDGMGLGYNARAALITRGLAELTRLGQALGGRPETFAGLTGMGDLVLTCTGPLSRNRQLGELLGEGTPVGQLPEKLVRRAEGVRTAAALHGKARHLGVEMPITEHVYRVLYEGEDPRQAVAALMQRSPKSETGASPA